MDFFDAAERYQKEGHGLIILAGNEYGCGSSRDWAAKGTFLLGVKAVIAESYERIHRSNLVGMGVAPLVFTEGQSAGSLGLDGTETFSISNFIFDADIGKCTSHHNLMVTTTRTIRVKLTFWNIFTNQISPS